MASFLAAACVCLCAPSSVSCQTDKLREMPVPGKIAEVTCASDSSQSYALYLPSGYTPAKRWPVIYFFDPGGRGRRPLELYKDIAETYGFVFAGSNNSRNFGSDSSKSVNAIWQDTHAQLALEGRRAYSSGFSGGARIAGAMALNSSAGQIAGVIAHGAGYPNSGRESKDKLLYFFAVGDEDFNWPEVVTVRREREERGAPYRVREFSGGHEWAPAAVMEDAVQWLVLKAMQSGDLQADRASVERMFRQRQQEIADAEKTKDAIGQLGGYRSLVSDFAGLHDVGHAAAKLAALRDSAALKAALKSEREQVAAQFAVERELSPQLSAFVDGSVADTTELRLDILQKMRGLRDSAAHSKNAEKRLIAKRTFDSVWVGGIEDGQQELESRHFEKAERYFDLMREASDSAWPALLLADTHAAAGNRKQAIKDLQEAVRRGLKDADAIESDARLEVLKGEPEFQKIVAGLRGK